MASIASSWTWAIPAEHPTDERADRLILQAMQNSLGNPEPDPAAELPECTRSQLQKWMDEGMVTADGQVLRASSKLKPGQRVHIDFPPPKPSELVPENRPIEILYEDEHILVVNKPPGLTVHPSPTQMAGTLVHALLFHVHDLSGIGGVLRPGIVHRIDKDTSGALVVTKTDAAHHKLMEVFSKHQIERRYWALVYSAPKESGEFRIESLIGRSPSDRIKMSMNVKTGRKAITHVRKIEEYATQKAKPFASWVEARLETGRTHQVRVHLTGTGHSLLGDPVYGIPSERHPKWLALPPEIRELVSQLPGQALHARVLGFDHPITGKPLRFEAEPPPTFRLLLEALQRYR